MANQGKRIDICLATYNGARWIQEFLDSLDAQSHARWRLIVSDDASKDDTLEIIRAHFRDAPDKLVVARRAQTGLGVVKNFEDALLAADADYLVLADQDDVWVPAKLATLLALMHANEAEPGLPTLVFSDLEVVDEHLATLERSWWNHIGIKADWARSFSAMLSQNIVPGCAMMINRRLRDLALPIPNGVIMHDWWFLLAALAIGKVGVCEEQLVRYRRHAGAHTYWNRGGLFSALLRQYHGIAVLRRDYTKTVVQAEAFEKAFGGKLGDGREGRARQKLLHDYIEASRKGWWQKRWLWVKNRIHLVSILQTTKFYMWI